MTIIFSDEFELGSLVPPWTVQNEPGANVLSISQDIFHHGGNCLKAVTATINTNCCMEKVVGSYADLYFREYWATPSFPASANLWSVMDMANATDAIAAVYLWISGASQRFCVRNQVTATNYNTVVFPGFVGNKFYCTELYVHVDNAAGIIKVWLDGNLMYNQTGIDTSNAGGNITTVRSGICSERNSVAATVYTDCCVVSDRYIGTEFQLNGRSRFVKQNRNTQFRRNDHNPYYPQYPPRPDHLT